MAKYKRIILKLSGETLAPLDLANHEGSPCYDSARVDAAARVIAQLSRAGVETGVVLGGGNIWRGRFTDEMEPCAADQMGMLATVCNALCLEEALHRAGVGAVTFTAQEMNRFARLYTAWDADEALKNGQVVILAGGSGNPFFTTDTAAALRAAELHADALFKGTTVDGVYDGDPHKKAGARLLPDITYREAIEKNLAVMDTTAFDLCLRQGIPEIRVFSMAELENILRVADGEMIGSVVHA